MITVIYRTCSIKSTEKIATKNQFVVYLKRYWTVFGISVVVWLIVVIVHIANGTLKQIYKEARKNIPPNRKKIYGLDLSKMMIQLFEDAPQASLLFWMLVTIFRGDGIKCQKKLYQWGQDPTNWDDGASKMLKAHFAHDATFNEILRTEPFIAMSLSIAISMMVMSLFTTTIGTCKHKQINKCQNHVKIWILFTGIVSVILASAYYRGVKYLDREDTIGGKVVLGAFLLFLFTCACLTLILFVCWPATKIVRRTFDTKIAKIKHEFDDDELANNVELTTQKPIKLKDNQTGRSDYTDVSITQYDIQLGNYGKRTPKTPKENTTIVIDQLEETDQTNSSKN
eukprot:UN05203